MEQERYGVQLGGSRMFEAIRRIGLAGEALAQLRADYERRPSELVCQAIRRKIQEIAMLGLMLEEENEMIADLVESAR